MASRLIDSLYQFDGARVSVGQAMQWPRLSCSDPDVSGKSRYVPEDVVPDGVTLATCEMARELIVADRTAASPGEGLKYQNAGTTQTGYDKADTRPVITQLAQAMLSKFGTLVNARSGTVKLIRT